MRITRRVFCAASIFLAFSLVSSCDNGFGIFQNVQGEKKQIGTKVFQATSVFNAFGLGGYYYAATATLNRSLVGEDNWSLVAINNLPNSSTTYTLRSAVLASGANMPTPTIFALIETGVEPSITVSVYSSTDGASWTAVSLPTQTYPPSATISNFDALFSTSSGDVYAENHSYAPTPNDPNNAGPSSYTLYRFAGGSFANLVSTFTPANDKTIRGVVFDGSNYWFASEDLLYSGTFADGTNAANSLASFPGLAPSSTISIWDISHTGGYVFVTSKGGYIYRSDGVSVNPLSATLPLTQVIEVPTSSGNTLLIGTDATSTTQAVGYYEGAWGAIDLGSKNYAVALNSSIFSETIGAFPVHAFYFDSSSGNLFICVSPGYSSNAYYGLYKSTWSNGSWSGWSAQ